MATREAVYPEQVVNVLRQIEVAIANGKTTPAACKEVGFTEQTYYRWRKEYGGLKAILPFGDARHGNRDAACSITCANPV